jgi:hypothetical protein
VLDEVVIELGRETLDEVGGGGCYAELGLKLASEGTTRV